MTASISSAVIGVFRFSASSSFSLEDYIFLEMCPFHLGFQISWHTVLHSNFVQSFVLGGIHCSLSSFISDCVHLGHLSFFLDEPAKGLVDFIYLFKEPAPRFIDP